MRYTPVFSKDDRVDKSLQHSIKDGVAFSLMTGSSESYFAAFAIFLKATAPQVALLASLPPLIASFFQIFAVYLGQHTGVRKQIVVLGAVIQLLALGVIAAVPALFGSSSFSYLLGFVVLYFVGANLGAPLWGSLMGALVPEASRGRFFATRTRLSSVASFSALLAAGLILQLFFNLELTYYGFVAIFSIGVIARLVSIWHLSKLYDPPHDIAIDGDLVSLFQRGFFSGERRFLLFTTFNAFMQGAVAISGPMVAVYLLRVLDYSYIQLTINTAASVLVQFLVLSRWGRLSDLFGNRIILQLTGFTIPLIPILWIVSANFYYLLAVQALSGLVWSGFSLSASNSVYDLTSRNKRAGLMATHGVLAAVYVFVGASLGGWLAVTLPAEIAVSSWSHGWATPIYGVFLLSAIARLLVALTFLPRLKEVREVRSMTHQGLFFRATRFSSITGLMFEVVARRTRKDDEP